MERPLPLPRTLVLDYHDSCTLFGRCYPLDRSSANHVTRRDHPSFILAIFLRYRSQRSCTDTNNILTLFTELYDPGEVQRQVTILQADSMTWYASHPLHIHRVLPHCRIRRIHESRSLQGRMSIRHRESRLYHPLSRSRQSHQT
jgi:hypothetical protein